ncbi:MAG: superoxide dismutase [Candidatus Omnitrophica bacterium]|nr:superoxide dismutase [Candidatus Omnitrophota bacterium]
MKEGALYVLPELTYNYDALEPYISEQQLRLHHDKHHQAYVKAANALFEKLDSARKENADIDVKAAAKELSFNIGGHVLHTLFWENLRPKGAASDLKGPIKEVIDNEFGSFERFKSEFTKAAVTTEGSGWAALSYSPQLRRPVITQIEKHNLYLHPSLKIVLVLDVWEHAYYLDYKNERAKFVEAVWNIINWNAVNERIAQIGVA